MPRLNRAIVLLPLLSLVAVLFLLSFSSAQQARQSEPAPASGKAPELFAAGVINTSADEYGPAFTPDGRTLHFTRRVNRRDSEFIYVSHLNDGKWSEPVVAPFSGKYFDKEPFVTPDGSKLFFASLRPVNGKEVNGPRDFNIWFARKTPSGWGEPQPLEAPVNSPGYVGAGSHIDDPKTCGGQPEPTSDLIVTVVRAGEIKLPDQHHQELLCTEDNSPEHWPRVRWRSELVKHCRPQRLSPNSRRWRLRLTTSTSRTPPKLRSSDAIARCLTPCARTRT
ncbi:MAG TPA: hypothetical protein VFD58_12145 [Blastocatellia bacterium]|nr:hypothetical protein [Blastocatellia bacterium]